MVPATIGAEIRINYPGVGAEKGGKIFLYYLLYWNSNSVAMRSAAKKIRKKSQREAARVKRQGAPGPVSEDEDPEVHFRPVMDCPESPPLSPPASPTSQGEADYGLVLDMVESLKDKLSALNLDNYNIRAACDALR